MLVSIPCDMSQFYFSRYGFAHIGRVGSVFMTLSVTLERFFAIVYPLKRLRLKSILIGASTLLSVVYNIPRFLEFETVLVVDTNSTNNASVSIYYFVYLHCVSETKSQF